MRNLYFVDGDNWYNYGEHEYINCLSSICAICSKKGIPIPYVREEVNNSTVVFDIGLWNKMFVWGELEK